MTKILYIAGYGRSGSTVLDIILDNHSRIAAVGEVSFLLDDWGNSNRLCSCGVSYSQCEFWKSLFPDQSLTPELAQVVRSIEKLSSIPRLLLGLVRDRDRQRYRAYQEHLFGYVTSRSGNTMVVDSSKSAKSTVGRFLALTRLAGQDVYVLHLIRNGLATMESLALRGRNWAIEGHIAPPKWPELRAILGWASTNAWTSILGRLLGPKHYRLLRYEDFLEDPGTALRGICQFCGIEADELIERVNRDDYFQVGHLVGGNRVRFQRRIKLQRDIRPHYGDRLKLRYRLLFVIAAGMLNRHYGYE